MKESLSQGTHVCQLFSNDSEQKGLTLEFLSNGLRRGEYCALACAGSPDDWLFELQAAAVDVSAELASGTLDIFLADDWYSELNIHTLRMAGKVWNQFSAALDVFGSARLIADMSWVSRGQVSADDLCHWEAAANVVFEGTEVRVICQYDLRHNSPSEVLAALRTHPQVILDGRMVGNRYYEAPRILAREPRLNRNEANQQEIEDMLRTLRSDMAA